MKAKPTQEEMADTKVVAKSQLPAPIQLTWRIPGHPHALQRTIPFKLLL